VAKRTKRPQKIGTQEHGFPVSNTRTLTPKTRAQSQLIKAINSQTLVFATGSAGTGKTFVCTVMACDALRQGKIDKLIITRPAMEAGERLGFLPGELHDKYAPYLEPFMGVFEEWLGKSYTEYLIKTGKIVAKPLGFMRGVTFKNAWVILDEAQNTTVPQMKMFLTRLGEGSKMLVNGDPRQTDLQCTSGLSDALRRLDGVAGISTIHFVKSDVVRHSLVQEILEAYES
jgi:Phosphate starvation-inducible protein PhoH, predicted ATPase